MRNKKVDALLIFFAIFCLFACNMQKYCQERYPAQISDSVVTTIEYRPVHDTLYLGYNELVFDTATEIPPNILIHHEEKKGGLKLTVDIKNGRLNVSAVQDSLMRVIDGLKKTITTSRKTQSIQQTKEFVEHWYLTPLVWYFFVTIAFFAGMVAKKVYKRRPFVDL